MRKGLVCILSVVVLGCSRGPSVQVQHYVEAKDERASLFVGSPDPERNAPEEEKFLVQWNLKGREASSEFLELEILYGNMTVETIKKRITQTQGVWIYRMDKKKVQEKSGILTYRVQLKNGKEVIAQWEDLLWFSLITRE